MKDADPTPETLVDFIERLEETSPIQKKAFIQQNLNVVKKAGSLSLRKIEPSGLRAASVGYEFVDGKTLSGKMSGADVDVLVPKSLLGQLKYLEGFEPAEDMQVEFNGWVKAWDGSEQSYQIIASKIKVPFSQSRAFTVLLYALFSPIIVLFFMIRWTAILFWYALIGLVLWRVIEWQQPFGCQIDMWLCIVFFGGGMFKFYWWAITLSGGSETFVDGIETPVEDLEELTDDMARVLSGFDGDLSLHSLERLTDRQAAILCRHRGGCLDLSGLLSLSDGQAENLAIYPGTLILVSVQRLSDKQAEFLSQFTGELYLGSIETLSDRQLDSLKAFQGVHLELPEEFRLKLEGGFLESSLDS